jgi:NDP-sugar pyrophosphorylase family protein
MKEKKEINIDVYTSQEDTQFPLDYFEMYLQEEEKGKWLIFYVDKDGNESKFGTYEEAELLKRITQKPFYFEEIVFVYYLVEHKDKEIKDLGIRLLKQLANT